MEGGQQTGKWCDLADLKKTELQCDRGREEGRSQEISHSSELSTTGAGVNEAANSRGTKGALNSREPSHACPHYCLAGSCPKQTRNVSRQGGQSISSLQEGGKAGDKELRSGGWDYSTNTFPLLGSLKLVYRFIMERASWKILFWRCWPAQQKYWHLAVYEKQK